MTVTSYNYDTPAGQKDKDIIYIDINTQNVRHLGLSFSRSKFVTSGLLRVGIQ